MGSLLGKWGSWLGVKSWCSGFNESGFELLYGVWGEFYTHKGWDFAWRELKGSLDG